MWEVNNMVSDVHFNIHTLPDIEMYGGDTLPWEVTLIRDDGSKFSVDTASECICKLSFTPLKATSGLGNNSVAVPPIFEKIGEAKPTLDGSSVVVFAFSESDTKGLRGKFLYQIEVRHDDDLRLCQGSVYIKQNINR